MNQSQYNQLFSFLWNIANDVLVQAFEKGKYKEIIMPMLVLRRLDILLEPTKEQVLERKALFEQQNLPEASRNELLKSITRLPYFNVSPYTMKSLRGEPNSARLLQNFRAYLNGFSDDVQDIIGKFDLMHHAEKLNEVGRLGAIIEKFTDERINLGITPVVDNDGNEILPALDNHTMGTLFEELLRRFNEENNVTEAGEHFTPRDYVNLLADLAVLPIAGQLKNSTYEIYDGACGTGGILSIVADRISKISAERGLRVRTNLYGQELQPDTFATCKADLMLSEQIDNFEYTYQGERRNRIAFGSTISQDGHANKQFDFCISNPPFGTPWKRDLENWGLKENQKKDITDIRFKPTIDGTLLDFVPGIGDPQMLFLANNVSRMKESEIGTRIVEVHNGSSLFTGNAGGGESNLRRYIIENDMLEAIVAMPENSFYNTGIGTFVWIVTNRKEARRKGKVQLIDATKISAPLRKNLGNKNCEVGPDQRRAILELLTDFEENEQSKIFDNREFGYWQITVVRPNPENPKKPLKDTEQVPLLYPGGIEGFMEKEVLPYTPDAKVDPKKTVIGYELSFTKYFYKPVELRSIEDITADILAVESATDGLLHEILGLK
jgi:type I restriction enzyme M protein